VPTMFASDGQMKMLRHPTTIGSGSGLTVAVIAVESKTMTTEGIAKRSRRLTGRSMIALSMEVDIEGNRIRIEIIIRSGRRKGSAHRSDVVRVAIAIGAKRRARIPGKSETTAAGGIAQISVTVMEMVTVTILRPCMSASATGTAESTNELDLETDPDIVGNELLHPTARIQRKMEIRR